MTKDAALKNFDAYLSSNFSTVLHFFWRSGIALFIIGLIYSNLGEQKKTHSVVIQMQAKQTIMGERQAHMKTDVSEIALVQKVYGKRINIIERDHDVYNALRKLSDD